MKIKIKLSLMMAAIIAVVVVGVCVILLTRSRTITHDLSFGNMRNLAAEVAEYWKGREDGYMRVLSTMAHQMAMYEEMPDYQRRDQFDMMLKGVLEGEPNMTTLYSVWKPNAVDGDDAASIGRMGSTETGQYACKQYDADRRRS